MPMVQVEKNWQALPVEQNFRARQKFHDGSKLSRPERVSEGFAGSPPSAVKSFGPGKHVLVRLAAWASPRAFRPAWTRGAMPTRLNDLETLHGVGVHRFRARLENNPG
ncbi:hypothetical protein LF1_40830 [Rubripirellula obstinata]|uniref:Uncharacterized protein n=1 Tax=Rubripirellula obstinata TaxID=406547 RepID=A0A5B1CQ77_9BACT|nr:hypothetical protein LF1_40830 [Rubripirellula obstinata]